MWTLGEVTTRVRNTGISWSSGLRCSVASIRALIGPWGQVVAKQTQVAQDILRRPFPTHPLTVEWSLCSLESSRCCLCVCLSLVFKGTLETIESDFSFNKRIGKPIWGFYHEYAPGKMSSTKAPILVLHFFVLAEERSGR